MATNHAVFATVADAVSAMRAGKIIVVVDDEDRENEGDLTMAAEFVTPQAINFMAKKGGGGLICLTLTEERADYLRLPPMVSQNTSQFGTAFTESIEARDGVTTGISAADRAHTIKVAIDPACTAADLVRPGHMFPLRARKGGVLVRAGQTEASVDLARMAGLVPAGVICEIMNEDGTMARVPDLVTFCAEHGLLMVTVADLIRHRLQHERYIRRAGEAMLTTAHGEFRMIAYENEMDPTESHVALVMGDVMREQPVPVRVHTHSLAEDVFGLSAGAGWDRPGMHGREALDGALSMIAEAGCGALLYLHNGTRGFGIDQTVSPHRLMFQRDVRVRERGDDGLHRTLREVGLGGQILCDLGIRRIQLLTNTPTHVPALQGFGIEIVEQVPIRVMNEAKRAAK